MTDTLDFPTIDDAALSRVCAAPPAPKTEVATAAAGALDLDKLDLSTLALSKFTPVRKQLADATKTLTGTVHDLSTQAKVEDAKSLRQRLLNAPLADARKISKGLKSKLKSTSDDVGAELEKIEAGFTEAAKLITPQIEAREAELAVEKAAREAKEAARRQEFEDKVAGIRNYLAMAQGLPSPRIEKGITFLTAMVIGDEWAEFKPIAQKALDETLASLRALLAKVQAEEVAAAERERIAAENARLKAENERIVAELAIQRAELQRQQDELAARQLAAAAPPEPANEDPPEPTFVLPHQAVEAAVHQAERGMVILESIADDQQRIIDESRERFLASEGAKAAEDRAHSFDLMRDTTHIGVDIASGPDQSAEFVLASPVLLDLLAHIAKAFDTKFPSQPKPGIEWWAELKRLAAEVAA